jgi:hypothetical protein
MIHTPLLVCVEFFSFNGFASQTWLTWLTWLTP